MSSENGIVVHGWDRDSKNLAVEAIEVEWRKLLFLLHIGR